MKWVGKNGLDNWKKRRRRDLMQEGKKNEMKWKEKGSEGVRVEAYSPKE